MEWGTFDVSVDSDVTDKVKNVEPAPTLRLASLELKHWRNIADMLFYPASRVNVIAGNNGHGKTSLLEAIYVLATSKSFRTARVAEIVQHDNAIASVRGSFSEANGLLDVEREQSVGLQTSKRVARIDGEKPASLSHYATRSPVVVFEPNQMTLSTGPASGRRILLDRVTLFRDEKLAIHRARYRKALRERQRLLSEHGHRLASVALELDAYETLLAEHGAAITLARHSAALVMAKHVVAAFQEIAAPELKLEVTYAPCGDVDPAIARRRLGDDRTSDCRARRTKFGPHRDDLKLLLNGHPARVVASQGQHRAITLAMKTAELRCISAARGVSPILLLDDVSSELDADRSRALFQFLEGTQSQIFITTTRPELITTGSDLEAARGDFELISGTLERRGRPQS